MQIIEKYDGYIAKEIPENLTLLEYLKQYNFQFKLNQISSDEFNTLKNSKKILQLENDRILASYCKLKCDVYDLKRVIRMVDPKKNINGMFIIEDDKIIYNPNDYFETSSIPISGATYYTDMDILELLLEELKKEREYLIYLGKSFDIGQLLSEYQEVSKSRFIECVTNKSKGQFTLSKKDN